MSRPVSKQINSRCGGIFRSEKQSVLQYYVPSVPLSLSPELEVEEEDMVDEVMEEAGGPG